jgi:hypothetical protein
LAKAATPDARSALGQASTLSDFDVFLFRQGTHTRLYDRLGAHLFDDGKPGARFAMGANAVVLPSSAISTAGAAMLICRCRAPTVPASGRPRSPPPWAALITVPITGGE